jgi:hypothetical protein
VTDPTCRGQPWYNPLRVRESRLSWRLDAQRTSFGRDGVDPEPWSLLQGSHAARVRRLRLSWPGCVLQPLRGRQDGSEARTHLRCCHAPCEISRRNVRRIVSLSGDGVAPDVSACLGRASLGGYGETVPPSGGACEDSADSRRASQASFGRSGPSAVQNANVRPRPLSGGTVSAVVQRRHQPRRFAERRPSGSSARRQLRSGGRRVWARVRHGIKSSCLNAVPPVRVDTQRRRGECLQLRWRRTEPFEPARSFSCLRSAPRADADCNRSCARQCAHPVWLFAFQSEPKGP